MRAIKPQHWWVNADDARRSVRPNWTVALPFDQSGRKIYPGEMKNSAFQVRILMWAEACLQGNG